MAHNRQLMNVLARWINQWGASFDDCLVLLVNSYFIWTCVFFLISSNTIQVAVAKNRGCWALLDLGQMPTTSLWVDCLEREWVCPSNHCPSPVMLLICEFSQFHPVCGSKIQQVSEPCLPHWGTIFRLWMVGWTLTNLDELLSFHQVSTFSLPVPDVLRVRGCSYFTVEENWRCEEVKQLARS